MDKDLMVYEPPMLAEVGDFDELTQGILCNCRDSITNGRYGSADEIEWFWV